MSTPDYGTQDVAAQGGPPEGFKYAKCTFKKNGLFAGYLSCSTNAYLWLTQDPAQAAFVKWDIDKNGWWWLRKSTQPNDRFLGIGDYGYADWGLWQAFPNGYIEPVIYNDDHTICQRKDQSQFLYGPYGDRWVCWGDANQDNLLKIEFTDKP
jgi:hypothetical protein